MSPKLNKCPWPELLDQPRPKRQVPDPGIRKLKRLRRK